MIQDVDEGYGFDGEVIVPVNPVGVVLLIEEGWRESTKRRTEALADRLADGRYATCTIVLPQRRRMALVSNDERQTVEALAERVIAAARAIKKEGDLTDLKMGLFASGAGGAAAMLAAGAQPELAQAVVMIDGRADLAGVRLHRVVTPTLFVVKGEDAELIQLNRWSQRRVGGATQLEVVPRINRDIQGVSDLDMVARRAMRWFETHLSPRNDRVQRRSLFGMPLPFARSEGRAVVAR